MEVNRDRLGKLLVKNGLSEEVCKEDIQDRVQEEIIRKVGEEKQ
jgi:hypothetical protein